MHEKPRPPEQYDLFKPSRSKQARDSVFPALDARREQRAHHDREMQRVNLAAFSSAVEAFDADLDRKLDQGVDVTSVIEAHRTSLLRYLGAHPYRDRFEEAMDSGDQRAIMEAIEAIQTGK